MSYGLIEGTAAPGTERVVVRVDGRVVATLRNTGRRFRVDVDLPMREVAIRVETVDDRGRRVGRTVRPVLGLPRSARPRIRIPHLDSSLQGDVRRLVSRFDGIAGVYVENLTSGGAAAWNARATFPAASTLKVGIAVALLSRTDGPPAFGTSTDRVLRGMLISSDNIAANRALLLIAGSTSGGGRVVTAQLRSIGLERTEMYGGYIVGTSLEPTRDVAARAHRLLGKFK